MTKLHETGAAAKLLRYYEANPDEEMTPKQVAAKFDLSLRMAYYAINTLVKRKHLESVRVVRLRSKGIAS